jgi:hypothetical protein
MAPFLVNYFPIFDLQAFRHLFTFPFLLYNDFIPWEGVLFLLEKPACQQIDQHTTVCDVIIRDRPSNYFLTSPEGRAPVGGAASRIPGGDGTGNRDASAASIALLVHLLLRWNNWSDPCAGIGQPQRLEEGH